MHKQLLKKRFSNTGRRGFTFVEIVAATALLAIMLSSVLVLMNRFVESVMDMRLRREAFELARSHMETLLSENRLTSINEYGESKTNPAIRWRTLVEPFNEPYKSRMWIRAVCSASFIDNKGEEENIELEHWITNLTPAQIRQIMDQQETEGEYMKLLNEGAYSDVQLTTIAYLENAELEVEPYKELLEAHRRKKLEYLNEHGMNEGYEKYVEQLAAEENEFLDELGMDFDAYNEFAESYVPPETENSLDLFDPGDAAGQDDYSEGDDIQETPSEETSDRKTWDWENTPRELWPLVEKLVGVEAPSQ